MTKYIRTEEERELVEASNDVRLKELTKQDAERFIEIVGKWGFYMGTTNRLSPEDIIALCKFLRDNYDYLTLKELSLIINLNLRGTLGKIEFFGTLSPLFMSQVINAYLTYKRENLKDVLDRRYANELPPMTNITKQQSYEILCDCIRTEYGKFRKSGMVDDFFSIIYNFLIKTGKVDFEDKELVERATAYAESQTIRSNVRETMSMIDLLRKAYDKDEETKKNRYIRNFMVMDLFSKITDIEEWISAIKLDEVE